jgi:hypothetical protein
VHDKDSANGVIVGYTRSRANDVACGPRTRFTVDLRRWDNAIVDMIRWEFVRFTRTKVCGLRTQLLVSTDFYARKCRLIL